MTDPFLITGPAIISFSGGRTSGYMLWRILQAHGGKLPDDVIVTFANTGKEREETLRFVHDCGTHWNVPIMWLEYRGPKAFEVVGYNSASRNGEPFAALIARKKYLPNAVTRFCTIELKIRTIKHYCMSLGWKKWSNVVGLRYDEGHRVMKAIAGNEAGKERWQTVMPLSKARVTKRDVMDFWHSQPFDLQLKSYEGNCDLCFLKGRGSLSVLMRENPGMAQWWSDQEKTVGASKPSGARFITETTYEAMNDAAQSQGFLFADLDEEFDAECGLSCAAQ